MCNRSSASQLGTTNMQNYTQTDISPSMTKSHYMFLCINIFKAVYYRACISNSTEVRSSKQKNMILFSLSNLQLRNFHSPGPCLPWNYSMSFETILPFVNWTTRSQNQFAPSVSSNGLQIKHLFTILCHLHLYNFASNTRTHQHLVNQVPLSLRQVKSVKHLTRYITGGPRN